MSIDIPIVITKAGLQPQDPATLRATLVALAEVEAPGLTTDLPGALLEDIASTDVAALTVTNSAEVDLVNSLTPYGANELLLTQLGNIYGIPQGVGANASAFVVFSGPPGFVVNAGWTVGDGQHQFVVQDGGGIGSGGTTDPLFCVAKQTGTYPVPANTINQLVTQPPPAVSVTCNNPTPGTPQSDPETAAEYRARVLQAGLATAQGAPTFLKTQVQKVSGVQARLVSVTAQGGGYVVSAGGGDPYKTAAAIYLGASNIANLTGCVLGVASITNTNPGVFTTDIAHGFTTGASVTMTGATGGSGILALNGVAHTITVIDPYTFSIPVDLTAAGSYTGGGELTPNLRNELVSIDDAPDTYAIRYVNPLQEPVTVSLLWNTNSPNFVSPAAVAALAQQPIADYINSIPTGQPINLFELDAVFQAAVISILDTPLITRLAWTITVNGQAVSPTSGTGIIPGDAFSYFQTFTSDVTIAQG